MIEKITLPIRIANQILAHAQSQPDEEICGLISGRADQVASLYPIRNVANSPQSLYQMDGKAQIDAMRSMRKNGEELYAIYHSHPNGEAYPSSMDVKEAQYPAVVYFIISLSTKGVLDLRAYRIENSGVEVLQVVV